MQSLYFHVDLDAFFATAEILRNPSLKDKPVLIAGSGPRSVVSTASYEARKYGCHSAMPLFMALKKCPDAKVISPDIEYYTSLSDQLFSLLEEYSDSVKRISIDEACMEMTRMRRLWSSAKEAATTIQSEVDRKLGLSISIGIATNPFIAKMASDWKKPKGICCIAPSREQEFVDSVGLGKLWGVGKATRERLKRAGIFTTVDLREYSVEYLQKKFGNAVGRYLFLACRGIDPVERDAEVKSHSISSELTFAEDITERQVLYSHLLSLSHEVMFRALEQKKLPRGVRVKVKKADFSVTEAQYTPRHTLYHAEQIYTIAKRLFEKRWHTAEPVRLLGVTLTDISEEMQTELFDKKDRRIQSLEKSILTLKKEGLSLKKASTLEREQKKKRKHNPVDTEHPESV